ncbi:MAG: RnfABCDGE type electron transport complex subunit D [Thermodesulfobacteriota bacterium]|nr:RnfABCDGE type electron transport complex subunit D [Thermodesulfobacteriota bacterium]
MENQSRKGTGRPPPPKRLFQKQPIMIRMVAALLPCLLASVYFFGFRALAVTAVSLVFAVATEGAFTLRQGKPVTSAVLVSALIYALSLPPTVPYWIAAVGMVFGIVFGKMVFGGFGFNVYNPAMVGRCFVYISFPIALTNRWVEPFPGFPGGAAAWAPGVDAVTTATPLQLLKAGDTVAMERLFWGNVSGSLGETSAFLILLGGAYLLYTRTAQWRLVVAPLIGGAAMGGILYLMGIPGVPDLWSYLLAGSFLFGAFFVVTEPISGPKTKPAQWIYGIVIGALVIVLRRFANFSEGVMFSVLFMNTFVPVLDLAVKSLKERNKAEAAS